MIFFKFKPLKQFTLSFKLVKFLLCENCDGLRCKFHYTPWQTKHFGEKHISVFALLNEGVERVNSGLNGCVIFIARGGGVCRITRGQTARMCAASGAI
jgi:hypothetical protein